MSDKKEVGFTPADEKKEIPKMLSNPNKDLYKILSQKIPSKWLYDFQEEGESFKGFQAQYAINLLNEEVGLGRWGTIEHIKKQQQVDRGWAVAMRCVLSILVFNTEKKENEIFSVTGYGACFAVKIQNAYKGAKTSAFKNACRYLGIGNELYVESIQEEPEVMKPVKVKEEVEIPNEVRELEQKIKNAKTVSDLNGLERFIKATKGQAVQSVLVKKFNQRKIELNR